MPSPQPREPEPVQAGRLEFTAAEIGALAHLYRGEVYRSTVWRTRLDSSTNWAVVTTGIALSATYSSAEASPLPMVLVGLLVTVFLLFEARRYRYFNVWRARARLLETDFYAPMIRGEGPTPNAAWTELLANDYRHPSYHISLARAIGRRPRLDLGPGGAGDRRRADGVAHQARGNAAGAGARQLLRGHDLHELVGGDPAIFFRETEAEQPDFGRLGIERTWKLAFFVPLMGIRLDFLGHKAPHHLAKGLVLAGVERVCHPRAPLIPASDDVRIFPCSLASSGCRPDRVSIRPPASH